MSGFKVFSVPTIVKGVQGRISIAGLALIASSSVLLLSGCSSAFKSPLTPSSTAMEVNGVNGHVHGGQQPVTGSTIQIYEVSAAGSGYGAAATPVQQGGVTVTTTTDSSGDWAYPTYTCASSSDELYVLATGGNPGLSAGTNNAALALVAALGPCSNISNVGFVVINEVSTVATAYSLAGFMTDATHVGTSTTNTVGLTNAFATFNNLENLGTGQALTVTPAYATAPTNASPDEFRSIVPYDTINTIADILATCVNTNGSGSACSSLFAVTGDVTDTTAAALYLAHNPSLPTGNSQVNNVAAFYNLLPPTPPFQPTLTAAPNDFTMTLNFISGGLGGINTRSRSGAASIAIDQQGNVWTPNPFLASVTELDNLGAPLSPTTTTQQVSPYTVIAKGGWGGTTPGLFSSPRVPAIDQSGNAWIADGVNCVAALTPSGSPVAGSPFTAACPSGFGAFGVAVDANNHVFASNSTFITSTDATGALQSGFPMTTGFNTLTGFLGADYTGHTWYLDGGNNHYGAVNENGTFFTQSATLISGPGLYAAFGPLATSAGGNGGLALWVPEDNGGTVNVQPINVTGAINTLPQADLPSTEAAAGGVSVDGNGKYYFAEGGGFSGTNTVPANITVLNSAGTEISPFFTGFTGGSALTALGAPLGTAIDQSGNLWVVNTANLNPPAPGQFATASASHANLTEFVGFAAPVQPVYSQAAATSKYGVKP